MLMWSLLLLTLLLCAVSSFPTGWCVRLWSWCAGVWRGHVARRLERELGRRAAGTGFAASSSFFARGVGLAVDRTHRLLFLAERDGENLCSAILPFMALRAVSAGEGRDSGFYDYYVDVAVRDGAKPNWRLLCGEDEALAGEVRRALVEDVTVGARQGGSAQSAIFCGDTRTPDGGSIL